MSLVIVTSVVDRLGPVLFWMGVVYAILGLMFTYASEAGGGELQVNLVPPVLAQLFSKTIEAWSKIAGILGQEISLADLAFALFDVFNAIVTSTLFLIGVFVTATLSFFFIAVQVSRLIPPPFTILSGILWIILSYLQVILLIYVIREVLNIIDRFVGAATSIIK